MQLVAKPKSKLIHVTFNRLRHCPKEISDAIDGPEQFWFEEHNIHQSIHYSQANLLSNDTSL